MQLSQLNPNEDPDEGNPALNKAIERNIRTIIHLRIKDKNERSPQNRIADAITYFLGRMVFVLNTLHGLRSIACKQSSPAKGEAL